MRIRTLLLATLAFQPAVIGADFSVIDSFEDGVFNADGQWAAPVITQGPTDSLIPVLDESAVPGELRVSHAVADPQSVAIPHVDAAAPLDQVGKYAQVTVSIAEADFPGVRLGLHLVSDVNQPVGSRADTFRFGMQADGHMRLHGYRSVAGAGGGAGVLPDEYADAGDFTAYTLGDSVTLRALRTRHAVPTGEGDNVYHHAALLETFGERIYIAWHSTPASEETFPYEGRVSHSVDGENWAATFKIGSEGDAAYEAYMRDRFGIAAGEFLYVNAAPRHWHRTEDRLYLWSLGWIRRLSGEQIRVGRIFWTEDGDTWNEIPPQELERLEMEEGLRVRNTGSNRGFIRLSDGRLMAAAMEGTEGGVTGPSITSDPTGLTGWSENFFDIGACTDLGEPGGWEGPDGVLHYTARCPNHVVFHSFSEDGGETWSGLRAQPAFPDNPGNKKFGKLPDGSIFYVGTPHPETRQYLVFSMSRDGWHFDESYLVRWEPGVAIGYEYPTALYRDGFLYVAYSHGRRDFMEISKIDASGIVAEPTSFIRGDANSDGSVNIADPSFIANFVFGIAPAAAPPCEAAADGNGDGAINIADVSFVANYIFGVAPATEPPAPFPDCGVRGEADRDCESSPGCALYRQQF